MRSPNVQLKNVAIGLYPEISGGQEIAENLVSIFSDNGVNASIYPSFRQEDLLINLEEKKYDIMIALGGDGTMLRAGQLCAPFQIPIMGINLGRFGFLMEVSKDKWRETIPLLLKGQYLLEDRMMLHCEHIRNEKKLSKWSALNEVTISRGKFVRPIHLQAKVDQYVLASYVADGLIVSTATGSTAYSLAVGGPIMPPELKNTLIIPVAPHLSMDSAIILEEGTRISVTAKSNHEAVFSVDGQTPVELLDDDIIQVYSSENMVSFIRFQDPGYFYRNLALYMKKNPSLGGEL
ncbi:MAG: NAD(+)/NADH kinase [Anaerolineaceae bacterium]|nr:NAD(+)/NADH kinase [Anaerolineaceae bacterium]